MTRCCDASAGPVRPEAAETVRTIFAGRAILPRAGALALCAAVAMVGSVSAQSEGAGASGGQDAGGAARAFDLMAFEVEGNSVLNSLEIQQTLAPYLGFDRRVADVEAARSELESLYQDKGYLTVLVDVPPQDVTDGVLVFRVVEGRVDRLRVTGADYYLPSRLKAELPEVEEGEVPNIPVLQEQLSAANAMPGRQVDPQFRAGLAPGTVEVDLLVEDERPWGASVEYNDQYNPSTSRTRLVATARYDNLFQRGHSANFQYQTGPEEFDEIQVFSGSYFMPVFGDALSVVMYYVNSNTDVATIGGLTVVGDGQNAGFRGIAAIGDNPNFVQSLMFGADYKNFEDVVSLGDAGIVTEVEYLTGTLQYRGIAVASRSTTSFNVGATFGLDGVLNDQAQFEIKREDTEASFIYFYGSLEHDRRLTDAGLTLKASVDWQYANLPLISNEQFTLGGVQSVRGYRQAEVLADSGVRASLQLSHPLPYETFLPAAAGVVDGWEVFTFVDAGQATVNKPQAGTKGDFLLGSAGVGTRIEFLDRLTARGDLAYIFDDDPSESRVKVDTDFGDWRAHFSIVAEF